MAELKEIKIKKLTPEFKLTVKLKIAKEFYLRLWIAKILIRIAAFVMNSSVDFPNEEKQNG